MSVIMDFLSSPSLYPEIIKYHGFMCTGPESITQCKYDCGNQDKQITLGDKIKQERQYIQGK